MNFKLNFELKIKVVMHFREFISDGVLQMIYCDKCKLVGQNM